MEGVHIIFSVVKKEDGVTMVNVYDISYDSSGYPLFLIYDDGQWKRISAKHYVECEKSEEKYHQITMGEYLEGLQNGE